MCLRQRSIPAAAALLGFLLVAGSPVVADGTDWSRFRGPNGSGVDESSPLPNLEQPAEQERWATPVPLGRSSPAVGEELLFLTAVEGHRLSTLAFDRSDGTLVWKRSVERPREETIYPATDSATPSPVTDGSNVVVFFQEFGLISYDATGVERWRHPLGPFRNFYGTSASPLLVSGLVIQVCDQAESSFVVAVDADSGKQVWRQDRDGRVEAYATPILYPGDHDPTALLLLGSRWIDAYEPTTGRHLWSTPGLGSGPVASLVLVGNTLFTSAPQHAEDGWPEFGPLADKYDANGDGVFSPVEVDGVWLANHFGWLDVDGDGAISPSDWANLAQQVSHDDWGVYALRLGADGGEKVWNYRSNVPYIPTPLAYRGVLYLIKDDVLTALDQQSGELLEKGRLEGKGGKVYSSPVAGDGKVFIGSLGGELIVLRAGRDWEVTARHDLDGEIWATPAIADGHLYVRTSNRLLDYSVPAAVEPATETVTEAAGD